MRSTEKKMQRLLARALGAVVAAGPLAVAVITNGACTTTAEDADASDGGGACGRRQVEYDSGDDGATTCETFFEQPCGLPKGTTPVANCQFLPQDCTLLCGTAYFTCYSVGSWCVDGSVTAQDPDASPLVVQCGLCPNGGRRPNGLSSQARAAHASVVGDFFAQAAHLEAASVHAFRILQRELAEHGAPGDLIEAAKRAEADEIAHARVTSVIAHTYGGRTARVRLSRTTTRSLEAIAIENAVEGCVRETFAALVAMWQAEHAADPEIAHAMKRIAIDEARHAALAWSVDVWAMTKLDRSARERVESAKMKAIDDLARETDIAPHRELVTLAGLPSAQNQRRLLAALTSELHLSFAA